MGIEALLAVAGLIVPPAVQLLKGWLMPKGKDNPEATMSTLATTTPDVLAPYTEALAKYLDAQVKFFNRDVAGVPSQWVINLRAAIRPCVVIVSIVALVGEGYQLFVLPQGTRGLFVLSVSEWFSGRVLNGG